MSKFEKEFQMRKKNGLASIIVKLISCSVILFFASCASSSLDVSLQASDQLNQDATGYSYAVLVRFYQLTDPSLFEKSDVSVLFNQDEERLGVTLVGKKEMMIEPGLRAELSIPKVSESKHLGVVAFFRDAKTGQQHVSKKVNYGKIPFSTKLELTLVKNQISLQYR
jgi:type VI secretion system protein VasD